MATGHYRKARTDKLKEEIAELEGVQEGQAEPSVKLEESEPTQSPEGSNEGSPSEQQDGTAGQKEEDLTKDGEAKDVVKDLEYWKQRALEAEGRFNTAKPKYDTNIRKLKDENLVLQKDRVGLLKKVNDLNQKLQSKKSNVDAAFTDKTVDVLGEETSSAIKETLKAQEAKIAELTAERENDKVKAQEDNVMAAEQARYSEFIGELTEMVPDQAAMNADQKFIDWLNSPNARGKIRMDLLRAAEQVRDSERVAQFFLDYKKENGTDKPKPKDTIASRTGPSSQQAAGEISDAPKGREFTMAEVDAFYKDVTDGVYKGRHDERLKLETAIEQAYLNGGIK